METTVVIELSKDAAAAGLALLEGLEKDGRLTEESTELLDELRAAVDDA